MESNFVDMMRESVVKNDEGVNEISSNDIWALIESYFEKAFASTCKTPNRIIQ